MNQNGRLPHRHSNFFRASHPLNFTFSEICNSLANAPQRVSLLPHPPPIRPQYPFLDSLVHVLHATNNQTLYIYQDGQLLKFSVIIDRLVHMKILKV